MFQAPTQHEDFHRLRESGAKLFNCVDVGVFAAQLNGRFEILSLRTTLGYTEARSAPLLVEEADWFAAKLQLDSSRFAPLALSAYTGAALQIAELPAPLHFSTPVATWGLNGIHQQNSEGIWGVPNLRHQVLGNWGRLFPNYNAYLRWIDSIDARPDIHGLQDLRQKIAIRAECGQDEHPRQLQFELELPLYLVTHDVNDHRTLVRFRTPLPAAGWSIKWKSDHDQNVTTLHEMDGMAAFELAGRHEYLQLKPLYERFSFGTLHTRVNPGSRPTPATILRKERTDAERIRFLFLSANPDRQSMLDVEREQERISTTRDGSRFQERIHIEAMPNLNIVQFPKTMRLQRPAVLHFSGHGGPGGSLLMRDERGEPFDMHPDGISRLIKQHHDAIRLVVLNACYSEALASLLVHDIDCVIGMTSDVLDKAAILFSESLYGALFDGTSIAHAFETAAAAVQARYGDETKNLKLECRKGVDPAQVYLMT
jgi:hypothetical protein